MSDIAIRVENLGKKYTLGGQKSGSFRESISQWFKRNGQASDSRLPTSDFWALKDINFEIKQGEAVGIIGRNGAGKSTLLKILSRITEPTKGRFEVFGRVSSLLEVGTGFHPELTGRENVYLNGTILGMKRREVKAKFDEIVAFSGVEKFIDTPVKHYSSGMQVRLAFAVAAHLEPEILIIDEVLAVGDAEFQKKCLGKMEDVTGQGRTVLFVSHNMGAIAKLCNKAFFVDKGKLIKEGDTEKIINLYLNANQKKLNQIDLIRDLPQDPDFEFLNIELTQDRKNVDLVDNGSEVELRVAYRLNKTIHGIQVYFDIYDDYGNLLCKTLHDEEHNTLNSTLTLHKGTYESIAILPKDFFVSGVYNITVRAAMNGVRKFEPVEGVSFQMNVVQTGKYNRDRFGKQYKGVVTPNISWKINELNLINLK